MSHAKGTGLNREQTITPSILSIPLALDQVDVTGGCVMNMREGVKRAFIRLLKLGQDTLTATHHYRCLGFTHE